MGNCCGIVSRVVASKHHRGIHSSNPVIGNFNLMSAVSKRRKEKRPGNRPYFYNTLNRSIVSFSILAWIEHNSKCLHVVPVWKFYRKRKRERERERERGRMEVRLLRPNTPSDKNDILTDFHHSLSWLAHLIKQFGGTRGSYALNIYRM